MVLPLLAIASSVGKAMKPVAKVKKAAWKAMGNAFGQIKRAVDPMKSFSKLMEVLSVLMLPLTYIMTIFASIIAKALIPYIAKAIEYIKDLNLSWKESGLTVEDVVIALYNLNSSAHYVENTLIALEAIMDEVDIAINTLILTLEKLRDIASGGGGGGGGDILDDIGDLIGYIPPGAYGGTASTSYTTIGGSSSSNNINIDLRNSVIDDRDKLIRDITEKVSTSLW